MLFEIPSQKSLEAIDTGLQEAAARHQFGIVAVHNLKETMAKKGVDFAGECLVYEVCNPHKAKKVLEANGAVSTALMKTFATPSLLPVAREVEEVILAMMREAA